MKVISLSKGLSAIVDDDMYEELNKHKWCLDSKGYAVRHESRIIARKENRKRGWIYMHRIVNDTPDELQTDHINRNKLDNRRCNLRSVTHRDNNTNLSLAKNNTSGYRGITLNRGKWQAQIYIYKKCIFLGCFKDIELAILARKRAEKQYNFL